MKRLFTVLLSSLILFAAHAQTDIPWQPRGIGGGGTLFSPSINPANHNEYFIACDMSEVFHTTDFGSSYQLLDFREIQGFHFSKVCFTQSGVLYSISYADDATTPVRSTDGGTTWSDVAGAPDDELFGIFTDYQHPERLLVCGYSDIYYSDNSGQTFTIVYHSANVNGLVVSGVLFDGNSAYVGTSDGVLITNTASTQPADWAMNTFAGFATANEQIFSFAAAKENNSIRFYCTTSEGPYPDYPANEYWNYPLGIYTCDYTGPASQWVNKRSTLNLVDADFPLYVAMAENEIDVAYLGGSNSNGMPTVYKTVNAGTSWTNTFLAPNNQNVTTGWSGHQGDRGWWYGEVVFGIAVAPNDPAIVVFGDYGFAHKTSNGGNTWEQGYVSTDDQHPSGTATPSRQAYASVGLENTSSWQVVWTSETNLFAAYSDIRGIKSTDGGDKWSFDYTAPDANTIYRIAQHPSGYLFAATSGVHDMYMSTRLTDNPLDNVDDEGNITYSTDQGLTWQVMESFNHPVFWIALDPTNPSIAYASVIHYAGGTGIGGVYRCSNILDLQNATWEKLPDPPRTQKHPASIVVLNDGNVVCTYSGRRADGGFTQSSGVFLYNPNSNTWEDRSDPQMVYWTKDIVLDPHDPNQNTWYAGVFSGWNGFGNSFGGLFKTTDRGLHWTKISDLPRVTSCTVNPSNSDQMFVTTEEDGLWVTSNLSAASPAFSAVTSYHFRQPERVYFNPYNTSEVWVTSFGNGLSVGNRNQPVRQDQTITFNPLPAKTFGDAPFTISATATSSLPVTFTSSDVTVASVAGSTITIHGGGTCTISARQSGNNDYNPAPVIEQSLTVSRAVQTITFELQNEISLGDGAITLSGTSSANLSLTFTSDNSTIAAVSGNVLTPINEGTTTITASQAGNTNYLAAVNVSEVITVNIVTDVDETGNGGLTLSPNPGNGLYYLSGYATTEKLTIRIIDMAGHSSRRVTTRQGDHHVLDIRDYASGIYILKISEEKVVRVIKQ